MNEMSVQGGCYVIESDKETIDKVFEGRDRDFLLPYSRGHALNVPVRRYGDTRIAVFSLNDGCAKAVCQELESEFKASRAEILNHDWEPFTKSMENDVIVHINNKTGDDYLYLFSLKTDRTVLTTIAVDGCIKYGTLNNVDLVDTIVEEGIRILGSR